MKCLKKVMNLIKLTKIKNFFNDFHLIRFKVMINNCSMFCDNY